MSQRDAWRWRPVALELRQRRNNLRRNWEDAAGLERDESNRVRNAFAQYRSRDPWYRDRTFRNVVKAGLGWAWPTAAFQTWSIDKSDVARSGGAPTSEYSPGTYDARDVPFGGSTGRRARDPKDWVIPDQPWPDAGGGQGTGGGGTGKSIYSNVRYERY